jgi:hypothetical protein
MNEEKPVRCLARGPFGGVVQWLARMTPHLNSRRFQGVRPNPNDPRLRKPRMKNDR